MAKLKIILSIPGHLKTVPMSQYAYQTLIEMGHEVLLFDFGVSKNIAHRIIRKFSKQSFYQRMNADLVEQVKGFKPDIFFTVFGFDHDQETIQTIESMGVKTACWWLNDPFQFDRSLKQAEYYQYYFTNAFGCLGDYKKAGIEQASYLPVGFYPGIHFKQDMDKKYEISFAGDHGPVRETVISELIKDFNLSIFGPWKKIDASSPINSHIISRDFFTPVQMREIFNQSKIVLNIHSWFGKSNVGINPRVIEANACGAFQLCDYKEEISQLYTPDKEIVLYQSIDELKEKIAYYLEHEQEREAVAEQAYQRSQADHSYEARMKEMISIVLS